MFNRDKDSIIKDIGKQLKKGLRVHSLIVYLNNGTKLESILAKDKHKNKPIEHFLLDLDGNILMYVDKVNEVDQVLDTELIVMTYIPKESIRCFDLISTKK